MMGLIQRIIDDIKRVQRRKGHVRSVQVSPDVMDELLKGTTLKQVTIHKKRVVINRDLLTPYAIVDGWDYVFLPIHLIGRSANDL